MVVAHCMLAVGISVLSVILLAFIFSNMLLRVSMDINKISIKCLNLGSEIYNNSRLYG